MRSFRAIPALLAGAALAVTACASDRAAEPKAEPMPRAEFERVAWDAERMTTLCGELARAVRDVRRAFRREPAFRDRNNPNQRAVRRLDQTLRNLDQRTTQLHNAVKAGGGYDETLNIARNIGVLLNDLDVEGRRLASSVFMEERVRPAMALINEIAPFYGSDALYDPESLQRIDRPPRTR